MPWSTFILCALAMSRQCFASWIKHDSPVMDNAIRGMAVGCWEQSIFLIGLSIHMRNMNSR